MKNLFIIVVLLLMFLSYGENKSLGNDIILFKVRNTKISHSNIKSVSSSFKTLRLL